MDELDARFLLAMHSAACAGLGLGVVCMVGSILEQQARHQVEAMRTRFESERLDREFRVQVELHERLCRSRP